MARSFGFQGGEPNQLSNMIDPNEPHNDNLGRCFSVNPLIGFSVIA